MKFQHVDQHLNKNLNQHFLPQLKQLKRQTKNPLSKLYGDYWNKIENISIENFNECFKYLNP